jgi:hypothetical protein
MSVGNLAKCYFYRLHFIKYKLNKTHMNVHIKQTLNNPLIGCRD